MNFEKKLEKAKEHATKVKQYYELKKIKHSNDEPKDKLSFSKIAFIFMMVNCVVIEMYTLIVMVFFADLSPLPALIAAVVGECATLIGYYVKSGKENTANGIVYETTMAKLNHELGLDNYEDNDESVG